MIGRPSKSRATSNDLSPRSSSSSSSSSSASPSSHSNVQLRKKSHSHRPISASQIPTILSDDSLSDKHHSRPSRSRTTYYHPIPPADTFGLTKTDTSIWANELDENELYPRYSIEEIPSNYNHSSRLTGISSRMITLQRGQMDCWDNCSISSERILTSSCENSTGSASHLLASSLDLPPLETPRNTTHGHIISITTTKRQRPSLLNQTTNTQWNIEGNGRYSKIQSSQPSTDSQTIPRPSNQPKNDSKPVLNEFHQSNCLFKFQQ